MVNLGQQDVRRRQNHMEQWLAGHPIKFVCIQYFLQFNVYLCLA